MLNFLISILTVLLLAGCSHVESRINEADRTSIAHGFKKKLIQTDTFRLISYYRITQPGDTLYIYIEGDGNAFRDRNTISNNPTPINPVALKLALNDTHRNIAYIARPCQFLLSDTDPACTSDYWTFKRYSLEVNESINEAISLYKSAAESRQLVLTGYSGGGTIAAVVAAMRNDVTGIRTVAGNLDIHLFAQHHNITPLNGSLNPVDFTKDLYSIPQLHIIGEKDKIVPKHIVDSYVTSIKRYDASLSCIEVHVVPGIEHGGNWANILKKFENYNFRCRSSDAPD